MTARALALISRWYSLPLILIVWQLSVAGGLVQSRLLPTPARVWTALVSEIGSGALTHHASVTFSRALLGFALAAVVGLPFAAAMARFRIWRDLFEPIFFLGYPVPKIALFPIFTYVLGFGSLSIVSFTTLECLYPIVVTSYFGFCGVRTQLIWTAQNCGADRKTIFLRVILPSAMPSIFAGLRVALPISVIIVVIAEMIGGSSGLGYFITIWSTRFNFANVYAAMLIIGVCGFALDQILLFLRSSIVYWER